MFTKYKRYEILCKQNSKYRLVSNPSRICIPTYGENASFQEFISGEIYTDNLVYDDYSKKADHWEFLAYFREKEKYISLSERYHNHVAKNRLFIYRTLLPDQITADIHPWFGLNLLANKALDMYSNYVSTLDIGMRCASLVSREKYLHGIFEKILVAHDWNKLGLGLYKYFLERHIEIDSVEGGHSDLMESLIDISSPSCEFWLSTFWHLRWKVYSQLY